MKETYLERELALAELHHKWIRVIILRIKLWRLRNEKNIKKRQ